jgi:hypothetical protein
VSALFTVSASPASAAILLTVDATNPSAIVFTPTGLAPDVSSSGGGFGLLLHGAMATDGPSSLQTPPQADPFRAAVSGSTYVNYGDQGDAIRMIVGGAQTQTFVAGSPAFIGTTTVDLSFLDFVTASLVGDIEIRDNFGAATGVIIGQYQFIAPIPEPTTLVLSGLGVGTLLLRRRTR